MILVTGGTGLVGSHLLYQLIKSGEQVKAIYRSEKSLLKVQKVFKSYSTPELFSKILWVQADITDYFSLADIFEDVQFVYHAAAMVSFDKRDVAKMMATNIEGTSNIVNLSLDNGVKKFCFVSSIASLGEYDTKCTDEEAIWQLTSNTSNYSISKYYAENEVWRASEEGLNVIIVNPATIIGYGDWNESSSTIIKRVYDGLSFYPSGSTGFVDVKDVVTIMLKLMKEDITNERFILVAENWSFKKLFTHIAKALNLNPPKYPVRKSLAYFVLILDQIKAFLSSSKAILTPEKLNAAYNNRCFSSEKIIMQTGFKFSPLKETVKNVTMLYKREL